MKHPLQVTALLVLLFFCAQVVGLSLLFLDATVITNEEGKLEVEYSETAIGERPDLEPSGSFLFIVVGVAIGTILMLLLIKFKAFKLWNIWFFLAVFLSLAVAFEVLIPTALALLLAGVIAYLKSFKNNAIIHNFSELFMYAGIVLLLGPLFDLFWVSLLLIAISIYDIIAVWHSKHMVTLAKAQADVQLFAGLYIPKKKIPDDVPAPPNPKKSTSAILGGGDIAFPLLFSAVVLEWLIESNVAPLTALYQTIIIAFSTTVALSLLFAYSKKDKFYPAMPFISAGCFLGLLIILIF